jgi:RNA polymerase sigma factor (sigma-70 family)
MLKHNDTLQKFTTSLYLYVTWECLALIKKEAKHRKMEQNDESLCEDDTNIKVYNKMLVEELLHGTDQKDRWIIEEHYFKNKTLQQIGIENGYSREAARKKLKKAIRKIQQCVLK